MANVGHGVEVHLNSFLEVAERFLESFSVGLESVLDSFFVLAARTQMRGRGKLGLGRSNRRDVGISKPSGVSIFGRQLVGRDFQRRGASSRQPGIQVSRCREATSGLKSSP